MKNMKKLALLLIATAGTAYAGDSVQLITSVTGKNPPVQIDIRNNKMCKGKKCLGNYIDFGKPGHANDHFNFDKLFGFTAMDSITWEETDNATGETLECSATISPELNNKNYYSMTFSKGCGLSVYNYSAGNWLTVTVTGKKQLKAPTVQPQPAAPKPATAPVQQAPQQEQKKNVAQINEAANKKFFKGLNKTDLSLVKEAITEGANVNARLDGFTPLEKEALVSDASKDGLEIFEYLLQSGADPLISNFYVGNHILNYMYLGDETINDLKTILKKYGYEEDATGKLQKV